MANPGIARSSKRRGLRGAGDALSEGNTDVTPERYQQLKRVFSEVCELSPAARTDYLDRVCSDDSELRSEVEALLTHDDKTLPMNQRFSAAAALGLGRMDAGVVEGSSAAVGLPDSVATTPERVGGYRIVRQIGRGGMGVVFEAEQENPRRPIALKVIRPGVASDQLLRRFKFEAQVLGRLQHPGIAQIYEAGTAKTDASGGIAGEQPFFAMEYVRGKPLSEYLADKNIGIRPRLELFAKICDAVQHAHQKGVIHRDLKPGNVLVDASGQPKILDFGVSRVTDSDVQMTTMQTDVGQLVGTIAYMSPEQVAGDSRELDTRSDVYALGVLLYQILTGQLPYEIHGKTIPEAARTIAEEEPTSLGVRNRVFRGDLDTICAKALEKDRDRRYQSAAQLAADVRCYLDDEPIAARPPSTLYQFRKFARRNRALVGGVIAVFVALVAGTIVSATQAVRATRAEQLAGERAVRATEAERLAGERLEQTTEALGLAERRQKEAETEAAKAAAVSDFLTRMFESVNPEVIQGYDSGLLRLLLDDAAGSIEGEFAEQPEVRASVEDTIGWVYHAIGEREAAEAHLQSAYDARRELLGDDDPETLTSLSHLSDLRWGQGRLDEAEELALQALEARRRVLGEKHRDTLSSRYDLAGIRRELGRAAEVEAELFDLINDLQNAFGNDDGLTLQALGGLAMVYRDEGRFGEAVDLLRRVLKSRLELDGETHPGTFIVRKNLATALRSAGALDRAKDEQRRVVELAREIYGEDHPELIEVTINLSALLIARDEAPEAEAAARDALERSRRINGDEHPVTLKAMLNLGIALRMQEKFDEATGVFQRAIELGRTVYGENHPSRISLMNSYAGLLYHQGKLEEAEGMIRQVVDARAAHFGETHLDTLTAMNNLGLLLIDEGKAAEGAEIFARLMAGVDQAAPPDHWFRWTARTSYGRCLRLQGQYDEAETVLLEAYENLQRTLGDEHFRTQEAVKNLVELYDAWQRPDDADKYRKLIKTEEP